eukprot:COSAG05_NODE_741_length_7601_cov_8.262997_7_plen_37_part_00
MTRPRCVKSSTRLVWSQPQLTHAVREGMLLILCAYR